MYTISSFFISFLVTFFTIRQVIPRLHREELIGRDLNKPERPEIPEMGGLALFLGWTAGILSVIGLKTFLDIFQGVRMVPALMALLTTALISHIGVMDDLIGVNQSVKAFIPAFASVPLVVIKVEQTSVGIPFLVGQLDFGIFYPLFLVPFGITAGANAVNMLAGFNGLEVGMGVVAMVSLGVIAAGLGKATAVVLAATAIGALLGALYFNWYPARILVGDVGTLSIGAMIATIVIIGGFELAGVVLLVPYFLDFILKAVNGFPSEDWSGDYKDGKLYCPEEGPVGLAQLVMKLGGGLPEWGLSLSFIVLEGIFGVLAVSFYLWF